MLPATLQFLIVMIASAINDRLQRKLDYMEEERRILWEQVAARTRGKKLSFTARERRRLAEAGKLLTPDERRRCCQIFFGERHLRHVVKQFMAHYHAERFHQGLGGKLIEKKADSAMDDTASGKIACRSRLGGMLNFYYREAA